METRERPVSSYQTSGGKFPFREWREGLGNRGAMAVNARVTRLATGNFGDCKQLGDGILESRIDPGPGYRIHFAMDGEAVILLRGGDKSTQDADIQKAKDSWTDYQTRKEREKPRRKLQKRAP